MTADTASASLEALQPVTSPLPPASLAAAAPELVHEGGAHCPPAIPEPPRRAPLHVSCAPPGSLALQDLQALGQQG